MTLCKVITLGATLAIASLLGGCGTCNSNFGSYNNRIPLAPSDPRFANTLQVQYLSIGGLLFCRGNDVVMTAPFYSNPNMIKVGLGLTLKADTREIDRFLPDVSEAQAILIGHAHYDHLLDVPHIANTKATNAVIIGSNTTSNLLVCSITPERLRSIEGIAGEFTNGGTPGTWFFVSPRVRAMALKSEHSPHLGCIKLFQGEVDSDSQGLPRSAYGWKEGQTLAYIIDFLGDNKEIEYRIVYHDAAVNSPKYGGFPKLPEHEQRDADVLVVCLGASDTVRGYPEGLIHALKPRNVIVSHWENFFKPLSKQADCVEVVPLVNEDEFVHRLRSAMSNGTYYIPAPGAWITIPAATR